MGYFGGRVTATECVCVCVCVGGIDSSFGAANRRQNKIKNEIYHSCWGQPTKYNAWQSTKNTWAQCWRGKKGCTIWRGCEGSVNGSFSGQSSWEEVKNGIKLMSVWIYFFLADLLNYIKSFDSALNQTIANMGQRGFGLNRKSHVPRGAANSPTMVISFFHKVFCEMK